jgi:two-component system OmpR family response regulator
MDSRPRILIVDDDPHIREVIRFALERADFRTTEAGDGARALELCRSTPPPDLVVLDILMPEMDGTEVCRRLRAESRLPIVFLSSRDDEIDRILGLELGGDDYLTKPFSPRELVARVRAVLRRTRPPVPESPGGVLRRGPLVLDPEGFTARWGDEPLTLTVTEYGLLRTLMGREGKVYTRDELMAGAYRDHNIVTDRTINTHVKRLRRKLAAAGAQPIETVHGVGYRLVIDDAP